MEFIKASFLNTSTMLTVNSNTATAGYIINRDPVYQYSSSGANDDTVYTTIKITFSATTSVSRLALIGMNFKEFRAYYNDVTASTFALSGADTTTSNFTTNADINKYLRFTTAACTTITIDIKKTFTANQEKYIGLVVPSDLIFAPTLIPAAKGYKPSIVPQQIVHKLSDGGTRIHNVRRKWKIDMSLEYMSQSQRDLLFTEIYDLGVEFNFCPFGTSTGWDGIFFEAVWDGPFLFYEYSDNAVQSGFSGKITLKETPF